MITNSRGRDKLQTDDTHNNKIANIILFLYQIDVSKIRSKYYYAAIVVLFYAQMYSIQIITQNSDPADTLLEIFWKICSFSNVNVVLSYFSASYTGIVLLLISIGFDILYIYYIFMLMYSSTNLSHNVIEKKGVIISFVGIFSELSKWILYIIKIDLAMGSIFCNDSTIQKHLDRRCSFNMNFSGIPSSIYIACGLISMLLTVVSSAIANIVYINIDFQKKNPLKPQISLATATCYGIIFGYILFSYIQIGSSFVAAYVIGIVYSITQLKQYFLNFPVLGKQILGVYGNLNLLLLLSSILNLIRDQKQKILEDNSHFIVFLLIGTVACACNLIFVKTFYYKIYTINLKMSYGKPLLACQYLSEICELLHLSVKDNQSWIILMGILELHQMECEDQYCPCQEGSLFSGLSETEIREKKKEFQYWSLEQGLAIPPQGMWLSELRKDYQEFKFWLEDFVEYHFYQIVEYQSKNNRVKKEIYVYFYFWSFEIYNIKNYVKALYLMKQHFGSIKNKSLIFLTVEDCISMIIESMIKERDKSLIYSNKQSDISDAVLVKRFSHLFHSEFQVERFKLQIQDLVNKKIDICDKLINNYSSLQNFNRDVKNLVKKTDQITVELRQALNGDQENVHYLKLLSLIHQVLYCHPQLSNEYESSLKDITTRDRLLEKDVIHSLSILNGDVASIVMSYKDQKCQLERYSNRTPNFFGYNNEEFKVIKYPEPLIPDVIAVYHNYYVGRIVREGNPKILRRYRQLVAKSKSGYLFPVKLFADYFFNIHDSLSFSALVLKLQTSCEYILVEHDGYIQGFSEGFFMFLRETSRCHDLDPNLLMQANIKIVFPTLLEFLNKYDENKITPNMTNHFTMEIPLRLNEYIREFLHRRNQLLNKNADLGGTGGGTKKLQFVRKLIFYFLKLTTKFFKEQTTVYDVKMRVTKDFLQFTKDNQQIQQKLFVLEITNMTISKTFENVEDDDAIQHQVQKAPVQVKEIQNDKVQAQQEKNNDFNLKNIIHETLHEPTFMESNLEGAKFESHLDGVKQLHEGNQESNQSLNLLQSQDISKRGNQQVVGNNNKLKLNEINIKPTTPNNPANSQQKQQSSQFLQQQSLQPDKQVVKNQDDVKNKTLNTQITLNKYQEVSSQNEQKALPASVNIRRQRSKADDLDASDANHELKEKSEIEELNKRLQSGFLEIIDNEQINGLLQNEVGNAQQQEEEIEKEYQKFCSMTSYVPSHGNVINYVQ